MVAVTIGYDVHDNCSPVAAITNSLSVTSNEPENGLGDGDTAPDWIVIDPHHVFLRAERSGLGNGRIYTIKITAKDDCGNTSTKTVTVLVPHNMPAVVSTNNNQEILSTVAISNTYNPKNNLSSDKIPDGIVLSVIPNPSNDNFAINVTSDNKMDRILIRVIDLTGRIIEERVVNNETTTRIGKEYLPGVYFINVLQGDRHKELKVVKE